MDFLKTPGSGLTGIDRLQFDEIKPLIDNGTNELLLRPDWDTNIRIVDQFNAVSSQATVSEIFFMLRKKLGSTHPKKVYLTLTIIEALVKNCGHRAFAAVNDESFCRDMSKTAKKYSSKTGPENAEVSTLCLDIIQAWGEAFLPQQQRYPNIPKLYQELRKERLPFSNQYDKSRVPIFTNEGFATIATNANTPQSTVEDEMLAAALAASLIDTPQVSEPPRAPTSRRPSQSGTSADIRAQAVRSQNRSLLDATSASVGLLRDMINAANAPKDIIKNEIAWDAKKQIDLLLVRLSDSIATSVSTGQDDLAELFKANDDAQLSLAVFDKILHGAMSLDQAKHLVSQTNEPAPTKPPTEGNLIDFSGPSNPAPYRSSTPPAYRSNTPPAYRSSTPPRDLSAPFKQASAETMGLFAMAQASTSPPSSSSHPAIPRPAPRRPSDGPPVQKTPPPSSKVVEDPFGPSSSSKVDDPFGPSTSSIDSLLSFEPAKPAPAPVKATSVNLLDDPFSVPATTTPSQSTKSAAPIDPLDSLLAIASRSDDFSQFSSPSSNPPPAPSVFPSNPTPLQPTVLTPQQPTPYQGYPPSVPAQNPYGAPAYGQPAPYPGLPQYPPRPGFPAQQPGWPQPQPQQSIPPAWSGAPQPQPVQPGYGYPPAPAAPPLPSNANPFDLF